jgi:hypothetical protein
MSHFKTKTLTLALIVAVVCTTGLAAFVLLNPARTWDGVANYIVDQNGSASVTDGDGGVSDVVAAINSNQSWNGAGSGTVVNAQPGNTNSFSLGDGVPMLRFDDPINVCTGSCLAATFTGFFSERNDGTWRIDDADIVTNTSFNFTTPSEPDGCSNEFFIDGIQVHEIGHGLGLGHSNVSGATMFPSVSSCNNGPATIETDDANGLNALYGNGGGGGGGGGGGCTLGQKGDSCTVDGDCCSNKCRGRSGAKTCK